MTIETIAADAYAALDAGDLASASALYAQLEQVAPDDPQWSKKAAGVFRRLGDEERRIAALVRAAEKHDRSGEPMKGLATLKIAKEIRPDDPRVNTALRGIRRAVPQPHGRPDSYARPPTGEHKLAVIPLIRRARTESHIGGAIVEVNAAIVDPRSEPNLPADIELEILPPIPLFSSLSEDAFAKLFDHSETVVHPSKTTVFSRGEMGDALYVIVEGAVDVFVDATRAARLQAGAFFGEMSLFTGQPRNATVVTAENTELIALPHRQLMDLVRHEPPVLEILVRFFRRRLVENVLAASERFRTLPPEAQTALRRSFRLLDVRAGTKVTEQGRPSPGIHLVVDGHFDVRHANENGSARHVASLGIGEVFGEISTVTTHPATATVTATQDALVLALDRDRFRKIAADHPGLLDAFTALAGQRLAALGYAYSAPSP